MIKILFIEKKKEIGGGGGGGVNLPTRKFS